MTLLLHLTWMHVLSHLQSITVLSQMTSEYTGRHNLRNLKFNIQQFGVQQYAKVPDGLQNYLMSRKVDLVHNPLYA